MKEVALITGASSGIGLELARIHASKRKDLILVARRRDRLQELKEELCQKYNIEAVVIEKDLSKLNAATELFNEVKEMGITVDYLINNAGFGGHGRFHERDWQRDFTMIQLNIVALA
ncbi:MAG: SDR family NAD(P)-dependent oxidoreductase, partial [Candidatus Obscuribacterales bacterium]|nr:SDR family NAD(P)-dependent oxidoreductase [Candidatus Obscuribacterales bacterium]